MKVLQRITKRVRKVKYQFSFGAFGEGSDIDRPLRIVNSDRIYIGNHVKIWPMSRIEAIKEWNGRKYNPQICIGDGVAIQQNVHITCAECVAIGANTVILPEVLVTDINHVYTDIRIPPKYQDIKISPVSIGSDCLIGMGARIMPGVNIGNHCVVGTNSVVTRDVPSETVVVGIPAKQVKKYNHGTKSWDVIKE